MFGKLGDMAGLMKQAKEMQENMKNTRDELAETESVGSAGGGKVEVVVTGDMTVKSVRISPDCLVESEREMLEEMIVLAVNQAVGDAKSKAQSKISEITGGLNIPGLFGG